MDIFSYKLGKNSSGGGGEEFFDGQQSGAQIKSFIVKLPVLDFDKKDSIQNCFSQCDHLVEIEGILNTNRLTNMQGAFNQCFLLVKLPLIDTSKVQTMSNAFLSCQSLNDQSLDNILQMCINATSTYTKTKTLATIGLTSTYYPASRIQALPHYQDFINAGWEIGY